MLKNTETLLYTEEDQAKQILSDFVNDLLFDLERLIEDRGKENILKQIEKL
ncbi:hypothetical protein [Ureibacillus thermosphaericus]|uniref:hypothetical protein n=1 Tax=Ureibacillus thermosphaericus TaxID=51173 RepID=UPI001558C850|nr:hypothetical protein [Ureibacillus thermosphaericus]